MKSRYFLIGGAVLVVAGAAFFAFFVYGGEGRMALAKVNGQTITADQFVQHAEALEEPEKSMFNEDPGKLLEFIIMRTLLLQEAKKDGFQKEGKGEEDQIREFMEKRFSSPPAVSREEVEAFYGAYKSLMSGVSLEEATPVIEEVIQKAKLEEEYVRFMEEMRGRAAIEINQERLKEIASRPGMPKPAAASDSNTDEDFAKAMAGGKPVLVDFGSNTCMPCRQLKPIIQEIKREYAGKVEVLVMDVYKYQERSREYRIQVIPTLVFFDSNAKEIYRQQGFMPKAEILEQLKKVGVS